MDQREKRLFPTAKTLKQLLLRSGNECAFPGCTNVIFNDNDELIAECCHIEAAMPGGERYNPEQTIEERRSYQNLLFLCHPHHIQTNNTHIYTVEVLRKIKADHENRFKEKPISINPIYISEIYQNFKKLSSTIKQIEKKQATILKILNSNSSQEKAERSEPKEYFGAPVSHQFKGRQEDLTKISEAFFKFNSFEIGGISGVGKTSFVVRFLFERKSFKILWIDCEVIKTREAFFSQISKFLKQELEDKSIEKFLSNINSEAIQKAIIASLKDNCICIVFDALNSNTHELFPIAEYLNKHLINSKIVITTNNKLNTFLWKNPVYKIILNGLDRDSFFEVIDDYVLSHISIDQKTQIYKLTDGHPFLLKLIASISQYNPIENILLTIENKGLDDISEYIKHKVFENLSSIEIEFLRVVSILEIPFRYTINEFISVEVFEGSFKNLRQKFLIEEFNSSFYVIPEFIKSYVLIHYKVDNIEDIHNKIVNYLISLKNDCRFFEKKALVYHALHGRLFELAKKEAYTLLSYLMGNGEFAHAFKVASEFENNSIANQWSFIYFVQGRFFRFQENYERALEKYESALKTPDESKFKEGSKFEKASILTYIFRESKDQKHINEAVSIYEELSNSDNHDVSLQSQLSLAILLMHSEKITEAINKLEKIKDSLEESKIEKNVKASMWQTLGDAYSKNKQYSKAFDCFDKSCDLYKEAADTFGMNIIDGLYQLYNSYGWTYANQGHYFQSVEMFELCVELSSRYKLQAKLEKSLFDCGFHLALTSQFEKSRNLLTQHYDIIVKQNLIEESDMSLIYGSLGFVCWYSSDFINALELMGLYILSCYEINSTPVITIIEEDGMNENIDYLSFFKKRIYVLIIPKGNKIQDLNEWINIVCSRRPELQSILSQFSYLKK